MVVSMFLIETIRRWALKFGQAYARTTRDNHALDQGRPVVTLIEPRSFSSINSNNGCICARAVDSGTKPRCVDDQKLVGPGASSRKQQLKLDAQTAR